MSSDARVGTVRPMTNLVGGGRIEIVRGREGGELADRILEFWRSHGALEGEAARERLGEVVCVLLDESGNVAGVNSVHEEAFPLIGNRRFWVYRAFLPDDAGEAHAEMFHGAFQLLEDEYHADRSGPIGFSVFVSSPEEMRARPEAIWPETDLFYAGTLDDGRQIRLRYFWVAEIGPGLPNSPDLDETAAAEYPLEEGYVVEPFASSDRATPDDILAMWKREGAIAEEEARRRVHQVQMVGLGPEGDVAGVSTAYLQRNQQLRMDLWYYRTFVARPHRYSNVAAQLIFRTSDLIEDRHVRGEDTRAQGLLFELENPGMRSYFNRALWLPANYLFIAEGPQGAHVRVRYFPDARAPLPG